MADHVDDEAADGADRRSRGSRSGSRASLDRHDRHDSVLAPQYLRGLVAECTKQVQAMIGRG
jgi:hypothetical protein